MNRIKVLAAILVACFTLAIYSTAADKGDAAPTITDEYTISGSGTLTITNDYAAPSLFLGEWWTAVEVCHTNTITNGTFSIERTRDAGFDFDMWVSDAYTNDSVAIEFLAARNFKFGDVIKFTLTNPVAGEETKVYITRRQN